MSKWFIILFLSTITNAKNGTQQSTVQKTRSNRRELLYYDLTIAVVELSEDGGKVEHCELILVKDDDDDKLGKVAKRENLVPKEISFTSMLDLVDSCKDEGKDPDDSYSSDLIDDIIDEATGKKERMNLATWLAFILPGTLWCGLNNVAANYSQLGSNRDIDACCRAHDFCPMIIEGNKRRYGMDNTDLILIRHCDCDDRLFRCLKDLDNLKAITVGHIHFDLLAMPCFKGEPKACPHLKPQEGGKKSGKNCDELNSGIFKKRNSKSFILDN